MYPPGRLLRPLFTALGALIGCALTCHAALGSDSTPSPWEESEAKASELCRELGEPAGTPERPFSTDVCSLWPDGVWGECCVEHDMAYWCGGGRSDRQRADDRLRDCVTREYAGWMGRMMRWGVWVGGPPWIPAPWRWGYGHGYFTGYTAD